MGCNRGILGLGEPTWGRTASPLSVYNLGFWCRLLVRVHYNAVPLVSAALIFPAFFYSEHPLGGKPSSTRGSSLNQGACLAKDAIRRNQTTHFLAFHVWNFQCALAATEAHCHWALHAASSGRLDAIRGPAPSAEWQRLGR
jgi:hypothetical protein